MEPAVVFVVILGTIVGYALLRILGGRIRFPGLRRDLEEEGLVLVERRVFTRFRFPMIKRVTFTHVYLTRRRLIALHWCSLNRVLQAPVGAAGTVGTETNWFEVESRNGKRLLVLRVSVRGSGRVRFHLTDPDGWLEAIRKLG